MSSNFNILVGRFADLFKNVDAREVGRLLESIGQKSKFGNDMSVRVPLAFRYPADITVDEIVNVDVEVVDELRIFLCGKMDNWSCEAVVYAITLLYLISALSSFSGGGWGDICCNLFRSAKAVGSSVSRFQLLVFYIELRSCSFSRTDLFEPIEYLAELAVFLAREEVDYDQAISILMLVGARLD